MLTLIPSLVTHHGFSADFYISYGYVRPSFGMDNLRDLVVNAEFLGRKHVDLRMRVA
ncbi:unnamed protein product [Spirodela intermedia]|uniref:Uncharacterized protein n=1 Tax=Spirodela intermedia TaxID=51605 RepID=A0A7I8JEQ6_SPIIN|nr:unnamed protein product [Spirodela intermedia]CAA6668617.1 unnamed protein product [Spirodela intermedia]